ncbi:bifunctional 5,10-methylenetetrahydrofolate dehydrogenase/5,10-methenyltetrahydrofolate cyclohydrolase [Mycoplasma sp. CSL10137]|uniref:bifunctional 5,10-methylenetetrahydrofolate dehydrogenase/5,10-methenyltetrahydrofolate cyclohydrolase n=1 Tax=unclassified Mycoplasma TaxID=2683645 RepID=UPI00197C7220|nr:MULTISPECIES: bifunctional 5,10-methylenetetrahydrofolate dehydrogenase/5,10-methenyltetrahydrofolate cyclohydrolase [unclassified Mycoplasma]MBN4083452.1 bifunctional 5,10-methylenetetrahydrofolate dehydrogenase/5,10-methenyltetrahydrofolate cyclohydrolase [Mycoplasma sp. CSL10137]MBN4084617.1 bifunctional 5,10-methylenetetrahydrofolate dehydrogenase/5,10-methenyltetrahydrofolate cyclohydrolase [Mycoplasma sp. CSL10166]MBU4693095.1 bifunctional 5,10-methylenetetrahydrofolate dehydrogenase/5,
MKILSGKELAKQETEKLKELVKKIDPDDKPVLSIVQVGDNPASTKYVNAKLRKCEEIGIKGILHKFPETISQNSLLKKLDVINESSTGVIIQLPLPDHIPQQVILDAVPTIKDVDGLSSRNEFILYNDIEENHFVPATARAVLELMEYYNIDVKDKKVCVVGRSHVVGKPLAHIIKRMGADVATYNENTGVKGVETGDIVIVAIGVAEYIKEQNIKEGAIVIDVGTNLDAKLTEKLVGDVDAESVSKKASALSPVPGGVGPMTVVCLLKNLLDIYR